MADLLLTNKNLVTLTKSKAATHFGNLLKMPHQQLPLTLGKTHGYFLDIVDIWPSYTNYY